MKSLTGTKTLDSLMKAFAGESQARNRYTFFASVAKKEGYVQISNVFTDTANNEKEHAERFYKLMLEGLSGEQPVKLTIHADYPVEMGDTLSALKYAAGGEHEEAFDLYPMFANIAREEGFPEVASCFDHVVVAEKNHEKRYLKLAANIEKNQVFKKDGKILWRCSNCGYVHEGEEAPGLCPACLHAQGYFEVYTEPY